MEQHVGFVLLELETLMGENRYASGAVDAAPGALLRRLRHASSCHSDNLAPTGRSVTNILRTSCDFVAFARGCMLEVSTVTARNDGGNSRAVYR